MPPPKGHDFLYNSPMPVRWIRQGHDDWYHLNRVQLSHEHFDALEGVYIVWHGGVRPAVLHVGHGALRETLDQCREDPELQAYSELELYVTWAAVVPRYQAGVHAWLAEYYRPKLDRVAPSADPIAVDLP